MTPTTTWLGSFLMAALAATSLGSLLVAALAAASLMGCAGHGYAPKETMRLSGRLPLWVLYEWSAAQYELDQLDPRVPGDPYKVTPYDFDWIYFDGPFWIQNHDGSRQEVSGATFFLSNEIMICCGRKETVRHEAWHAILSKLGDPRYPLHRAHGDAGVFKKNEQEDSNSP